MMDTEKIKELVKQDNLKVFYTSRTWGKMKAAARLAQHNECQRCKAKGMYKPCRVVHHKKYIKDYPELALSMDNLECLCFECHEDEHDRKFEPPKPKPPLTPERW